MLDISKYIYRLLIPSHMRLEGFSWSGDQIFKTLHALWSQKDGLLQHSGSQTNKFSKSFVGVGFHSVSSVYLAALVLTNVLRHHNIFFSNFLPEHLIYSHFCPYFYFYIYFIYNIYTYYPHSYLCNKK